MEKRRGSTHLFLSRIIQKAYNGPTHFCSLKNLPAEKERFVALEAHRHCKKRLAIFYSWPGRVWLVTSRLGMGLSQTFFYSVVWVRQARARPKIVFVSCCRCVRHCTNRFCVSTPLSGPFRDHHCLWEVYPPVQKIAPYL